MAVWCRQTADGEPTQSYVIEPHRADQTDEELLRAKSKGAAHTGWAVTWTTSRSFTAVKMRWAGVLCVREFWLEP